MMAKANSPSPHAVLVTHTTANSGPPLVLLVTGGGLLGSGFQPTPAKVHMSTLDSTSPKAMSGLAGSGRGQGSVCEKRTTRVDGQHVEPVQRRGAERSHTSRLCVPSQPSPHLGAVAGAGDLSALRWVERPRNVKSSTTASTAPIAISRYCIIAS
jgi:hypothetical protein